MGMTFMGYRRTNGRVGVRNYIAIIPSVFCANTVVERIAEQVDGAVALRHPVGCGQKGLTSVYCANSYCHGKSPQCWRSCCGRSGCECFRPTEL